MSKGEDEHEELLKKFHREQHESRARLAAKCMDHMLYGNQVIDRTDPDDELLLCKAEYSPHPQLAERYFVIRSSRDEADPCKIIHDGWIQKHYVAELQKKIAAKRKLRLAGCDAMYATTPMWYWTVDQADPFELWHKGRLRLLASREDVILHGSWWRKKRIIPREDIAAISGQVSADWVRRSVSIYRNSNPRPLEIAVLRDYIPYVDPTYDAFNIICDASWVRSLTTALSTWLDVDAMYHADI